MEPEVRRLVEEMTARGTSSTRGAILEAAATLFRRDGFEETTLASVAAGANCTLADVQASFEDKHDIVAGLIELLRHEADELFLITLPDELAIEEKLKLLVVHQAEWGNLRRDALAFFGAITEKRGGPALDLEQRYLDGTISWFARHRVAEELELRIPEEMAAHVFRALQLGFFKRWVTRGGGESFLHNADHVLDIFLNGVRAG